MLRSILIYLSKAVWARKIMTKWSFSWRVASRFVAGDKQEDAINAITDLNSKGINATLDHLGENVTNPDEACAATQEIIKMLERIRQSEIIKNCPRISIFLKNLLKVA
jgi:proline dehydrogenase